MRSRRRAALLLSAAAAALGLAATAASARAPVVALVGGRVLTVSGGAMEGATVVLRDGLIESVGVGARVPVDARVIDVKGLTLTPGLIDGYGGVGLPAPAAARGAGSGGGAPAAAAAASPSAGLAPQAMILDRVRPAEALKARDSGVTTALVVPREGVLPGRSVLINLAGDRAEGMVVKQPAALHLHLATLTRVYPGSLMGTMAYARQALLDAAAYRDEWAAYEKSPRGKKRPRYDASLAAWQDVLAGRETLMVTARRENDIRRAFALSDEFKVKVALAGAMQASRVPELLKARKPALLVSVNFDPPRAAQLFGGGGDEEKEKREIEEAEKNPAALHKAGIAFALVSGHAPDFLAGVRKAIERGLPREAALRAVTLGAAEALGVADRLGSLEAGKIANLVAWSGEPLAKDAKVKMVFVDGELHEPEEKERPAKDGERGEAAALPSPGGAPSTNQPRERQTEEKAPETKPGPEAPLPGPTPSPMAPPVPQPTPSPRAEVR